MPRTNILRVKWLKELEQEKNLKVLTRFTKKKREIL